MTSTIRKGAIEITREFLRYWEQELGKRVGTTELETAQDGSLVRGLVEPSGPPRRCRPNRLLDF